MRKFILLILGALILSSCSKGEEQGTAVDKGNDLSNVSPIVVDNSAGTSIAKREASSASVVSPIVRDTEAVANSGSVVEAAQQNVITVNKNTESLKKKNNITYKSKGKNKAVRADKHKNSAKKTVKVKKHKTSPVVSQRKTASKKLKATTHRKPVVKKTPVIVNRHTPAVQTTFKRPPITVSLPRKQNKAPVIKTQYTYTIENALWDYWHGYSVAIPGITFGSPSGYGASWGDIFGGIGLATRTPTSERADGSAIVGFGLGDADRYVGLEAVMAIISINPNDGGFGEDGNFALKVHRNLPYNFAVALGMQNIGRWGNANNEKETFYASVTKAILLQPDNPANTMPLFITFGMGNGIYRNQANQTKAASNDHYGAFGSVAWHFIPRAGLLADYNAEKLNLALSIAPFNKLPAVVSIGALDVTSRVTTKLAWVCSMGIAYNFKGI